MLKNCKISGFADEIGTSIEQQISLIKELKMNFIEFRSANGKGVADYSLQEAASLMEYLNQNKIEVSAVGSPIGKIDITEDFSEHFKKFQHVVELAKVFNTPYIRMFSFFIPKGENPQQYKTEVFSRMKKMVEYAVKNNVILLHENEKGIYGDIPERCLELMKEFYCSNFKCIFDFANFVECKQNTWDAYHMLAQYIEYIHIKDALMESGKIVPAGQGDGNLKEILTELNKKAFSGYLSLEPHLVNFAALSSLEKNVIERDSTDGEAAFTLAYQALNKILNEVE